MINIFADYENVHKNGLDGISKLGTGDRVILCYTMNAGTIDLDIVQEALSRNILLCPQKCDTGRNALDFQLTAMLAENIASDPTSDYGIISGDNGYVPVIRMYRDRGIHILRASSINDYFSLREAANRNSAAK